MPDIFIAKTVVDPETDAGQNALAQAYRLKERAKCLCSPNKPELYIAQVNRRFVLRRMPGTGPDHRADCASFDAPPGISGLGPLIGSAITEEDDGGVALKLDFALTLRGKRAVPPAPPSGDKAPEALTPPRKLTLTSLLHYLWTEAELTRWFPGMDGKRNWGLVRHLLLAAAAGKTAKSMNLTDRLYIPETFHKDRTADIARRREETFNKLKPVEGSAQPVALLIAEYKSHEKGRVGYRFTFKHLPDVLFYAEADLAARFERAFDSWLRLADIATHIHPVLIATFAITRAGYPTLLEIGMMPTSEHWLPIETLRDINLIQELARQKRRFIKPLRFNLPLTSQLPSLLLLDAGDEPHCLYLDAPKSADSDADKSDRSTMAESPSPTQLEATEKWLSWHWPEGEEMPVLPAIIRPQFTHINRE